MNKLSNILYVVTALIIISIGIHSCISIENQDEYISLLKLRIELLEEQQELNYQGIIALVTISDIQTVSLLKITDSIETISDIINLIQPSKTEELETPEPKSKRRWHRTQLDDSTFYWSLYRCPNLNTNRCVECANVRVDSVRVIDLTTSFKLQEKEEW